MSGIRAYRPILAVIALCALLPFATSSNIILNGMVTTLIVALAGIGWNLLGGFGGQFSFGHAAFFGAGAYATAILQQRFGVNAYAAFALACGIGASIGWAFLPADGEDEHGLSAVADARLYAAKQRLRQPEPPSRATA